MKKFLVVFFFMSGLMPLRAQQLKKYIVKGSVSMRDTRMLYLMYWADGKKTVDSAKIKNGKFLLTGFISEPVLASLSDDKKKMGLGYKNLFTSFFIAPNKMRVFLINNRFSEAKLTGSKTNEEFQLLNDQIHSVYDSIHAIQNKIKEDSSGNVSLLNSLTFYNIKAGKILLAFIDKHRNSIIATKAIGYLGGLGAGKDSITGMLNSLPAEIKNGYFVRWLKQYEQNLKEDNSVVGSIAPDFEEQDKNGTRIKLSGFKGKYILLDFWASWCVPCRGLSPDLKNWFSHYHSRGFNIISISSEEDSIAWAKAIQKDQTNMWYQILAATISKKYNVQAIPDLVLIDEKGIIIGRYWGDAEVRQKLSKKLHELYD